MKPDERVFYELIRENAPCKLYFDLEYAKALNRDVDEERIMRVFTSFVLQELHSMFKIQASLDNIVDVSRFVSSLTMKILSEKRSLEALEPKTTDQRARLDDLSCLFIQTEAGPSLFIDDGVYSKNRNFRVFQSTKIGKSAFLQRFGSPESTTVDPSLCDYFLSTLVSSVTWTHGTRVLQMHQPMNPKDGNVIDVGINQKGRGLCTSSPMKDVSPFPDIDSFLVSWIQRNTTSTITSVIIKSVLCFSDQKLLLYSISGNKFCFNIMREHKSNGVYYTVDLKRGIFNQRCHDPDCRHFMSKEVIIPLALNPFCALEDIVDDHTGTARIESKHIKERQILQH
ncbi:hypothetical protein HDU79_006005 [Rhizoclosmatium sp. JEL0117]|nr:hypothetical protein HDU79_006005 [Rhizoclosmatium sp. JEL0117]